MNIQCTGGSRSFIKQKREPWRRGVQWPAIGNWQQPVRSNRQALTTALRTCWRTGSSSTFETNWKGKSSISGCFMSWPEMKKKKTKNCHSEVPTMQETLVWFLGEEDPLEKGRLPTVVFLGFPGGSAGKEPARNGGDLGLIPGLGRSPGKGNSYPLQYSGLENSMDCINKSTGLWRVGHDWATFTSLFLFYTTTRNHFLIRLWHATKNGF